MLKGKPPDTRVHWWERWKGRKQKRVVLVVMRISDMHVMHPATDLSRVCSECREPVGIYPSGQRVIQRNKKTHLLCNRCAPPDVVGCEPAPGAETEPLQSLPSWLVRPQ
jgi:hypothetical protein